MDFVLQRLNIYLIPPTLSLITGITLAVISLVKGRGKREKLLFALVCVWFVLLQPVFILHHLLKGDVETLLLIERSMHTVYVFLPAVLILYLYVAFDFFNRIIIIASFIISATLSALVWTKFYIIGLYTYSWGYIAHGGIAFQVFGVYGTAATIIFIIYFIVKFIQSNNKIERLKFRYIILSFIVITILTLLNLPAINGIDFYPYGNFIFIPLMILAYGVLKHRLMDVRSIILVTMIWGVLSSLIIIPNVIGFYFLYHYVISLPMPVVFVVQILWFMVNYFYLRIIQPFIDQLFNRRKYNLQRIEAKFIENIALIKNPDDLLQEFIYILKKIFNFSKVDIFLRKEDSDAYIDSEGTEIVLEERVIEWFISANLLSEKSMLDADKHYHVELKESLIKTHDMLECDTMLPLIQNKELIGFAVMSDRFNQKPFSSIEHRFLNDTRSAASISIANSLMYHDLSELKSTLEQKVEKRTAELKSAMDNVSSVNKKLFDTNNELKLAHETAEMNMQMAVNIQASLLPDIPPATDKWDIAFSFRPMSGVSGDFYDFYEEDNTLRGVSLFDVSGHGVASGLITMIARSIIQRHFYKSQEKNLNQVMWNFNKELSDELSNVDNFLTGIILRITDTVVEYVNSGHPDMLYKKYESGKVKPVIRHDCEFKGTVLGVKGVNELCRVIKFKTDPGDTLLLSSDCIYEGANEQHEQYGEKRLIDSFIRAPESSAVKIRDFILKDFYSFMNNRNPNDDLTLIIMKRKK